MPTPTATLIFAGGGSGGHLFPGLAIAEHVAALSASNPAFQTRCLFLCSDRPLDEKILSSANVEFQKSPAKPVIARPKGLLRFALAWPAAVRQARSLISTSRASGPVHMVAMGGFVAAPAVRAANRESCPVTMVNLDAVPGKANRWIAPRVGRVFSAASVPPEFKPATRAPWIDVPPIVRAQARANLSATEARRALGLDPVRPVLMITGGSQGLRSLNDFLTAFAASPAGARTLRDLRWQVLHQTGKNFDQPALEQYRAAGVDARVVPFTDQIGLWWAAADLAVCTAGAGNIAEIWSSHTPALLLPYPHHKDQHQKHNARALHAAGAVVLAVDHIQPDLNLQANSGTLETLLSRPDQRHAMKQALSALGSADGAQRIAAALLDALRLARPAIERSLPFP